MLGGMWAVTFTDVIQFALMLIGALILLPIVMHAVGWWPGLQDALPSEHLKLVRASGSYGWTFILAIFLLGIEWSCVDQGLLQRAFGARSTRSVARGLVLAGIVTTPFALLWILPGLTATVLLPGLRNADTAFPLLIATYIPNIVLGIVVVGLLSSQLSTISGNLNGVSTIFASDLYANVLNRSADDARVLTVARWATLAAGVGMIAFAYLVPVMGGAVNAYLTVIAIMDMPLFIIAIVFGLLRKRTSWKGALTGYLSASATGAIITFAFGIDFNTTTFVTAGICLVVTPLADRFIRSEVSPSTERIWQARTPDDAEVASGEVYRLLPVSAAGKTSLALLLVGLLFFLGGVVAGGQGAAGADAIAVAGMVVYFGAGLWRTYTT
jgi:SSS family solute:Na+ symporter